MFLFCALIFPERCVFVCVCFQFLCMIIQYILIIYSYLKKLLTHPLSCIC